MRCFGHSFQNEKYKKFVLHCFKPFRTIIIVVKIVVKKNIKNAKIDKDFLHHETYNSTN